MGRTWRLGLWLTLVCCTACGNRVATVRPLFEQANMQLQEAYRQGDASAAAGLFSEDAVLMPNAMDDLVGREAIEAFLDMFFSSSTVPVYELTIAEIDLHGNTAYERGTFRWLSVGSQQDSSLEYGRYSMVRKIGPGGNWQIHRLLENTISPPTHSFLGR
jgi:uncharacterized protein (TIGR02246 family)